MGVTKYILKHPVTTVMALLCLVVFGISSVFSALDGTFYGKSRALSGFCVILHSLTDLEQD